jgi:hypothetical protein
MGEIKRGKLLRYRYCKFLNFKGMIAKAPILRGV